MRVVGTIASLLACCSILPIHACAQELDLLRSEVRQAASVDVEPANDRRRRRRQDCDDDDEGPIETVLGWALLQAVSAPYRLPRIAVDDVDFSRGYFVDPYCEFEDAVTSQLVSYDGLVSQGLVGDQNESPWMLRTRIEYADDFDSLSKIGGQLLLDSSIRFGIETEFNHYHEDFRLGSDDELWIGDLNFVYRFAQSDRVQMRSGIGVNWLSDHSDRDFGFNFTYGGDWFPRRPWVISTELDVGRLGDASLFHGRVTGGVLWRNTEFFVGYDHLSVGDADIDSMVAGLRFWL